MDFTDFRLEPKKKLAKKCETCELKIRKSSTNFGEHFELGAVRKDARLTQSEKAEE